VQVITISYGQAVDAVPIGTVLANLLFANSAEHIGVCPEPDKQGGFAPPDLTNDRRRMSQA